MEPSEALTPMSATVAERWEQFTQYLCLGPLPGPRRVGDVTAAAQAVRGGRSSTSCQVAGDRPAFSRRCCAFPTPLATSAFSADLRARQTRTSVAIDAPQDGRPASHASAGSLRQLADAPDDLRIEVELPQCPRNDQRAPRPGARAARASALRRSDPKRAPRSFVVTLSRPMGQKRGNDEGSFVRATRQQTFAFYRELVQNLKRWQATSTAAAATSRSLKTCPRHHNPIRLRSSPRTSAKSARQSTRPQRSISSTRGSGLAYEVAATDPGHTQALADLDPAERSPSVPPAFEEEAAS